VWFAPAPWLYVIFCIAGLLAAHEWTTLMGLRSRTAKLLYVLLAATALALAWFFRERWVWLASAATLWWICAAFLLRGFPGNLQRHKPGPFAMGLLGLILWTPALIALLALRAMPEGALRLLYVLFLVWAADVGAYLAGRNLGRHKLAPQISPGKTVEGAIGAFALCALWAALAGSYAFQATTPALFAKVLAVSMIGVVASIVGDLTESMFKRQVGVKDSGTLLPGHGGVLDRVDSILATAPVMALGIFLAGL
jgi:phosphatidate cytidylyltransferase